ncbi:MAG: SoxR reducing system RseC family protein [Desulfobacteraceae bacterium]|jgi:sigma-E factor negative regulatory protein RseC
MIREQGIVEEINKNTAVIKVARSSSCKHCADKDSCSVADRNMMIEVKNSLNAKEGDRVEISVPEGTFVKLSLMVYIFPIIALMIGAFLGNFISIKLNTDPSATAAITAALFLTASFLCLKTVEKKKNTGEKYSPRMTRIVISEKILQSGDNI